LGQQLVKNAVCTNVPLNCENMMPLTAEIQTEAESWLEKLLKKKRLNTLIYEKICL